MGFFQMASSLLGKIITVQGSYNRFLAEEIQNKKVGNDEFQKVNILRINS